MSLFDTTPPHEDDLAGRPLAERMRPRTLDEFAGQQHLLGPGKPLRRQVERNELSSMILWGPPGVGKTSLARLLARLTRYDFTPFSAVLGGVKEIKAVMADAERNRAHGRRTLLFVDEIHRFNRAQQDAFLPYVERGDIVLIGATTENPSFEVNAALLSRTRTHILHALTEDEIRDLLRRALADARGLDGRVPADDEALAGIARFANGDGRAALQTLEQAAALVPEGARLTAATLEDAIQRRMLLYDKGGEEHYNLVSALHKSIRSSDPDAAVYWLARMLEAGEDRLYLARRLVRMAIEDIGLADPRALEQAIAVMQTVHFLGVPEGDQALAQIALYLAVAPKSDAACQALNAARQEARTGRSWPVPLHLRNAPTRAMKEWGYGQGYEHAHEQPEGLTAMECLPEALQGTRFYEPTARGTEQRIQERMAQRSLFRSENRQK